MSGAQCGAEMTLCLLRYAILTMSRFIDDSITLSSYPLISPSLRLNERAHFLMGDTFQKEIYKLTEAPQTASVR
jgi:hypothetical protein